MNRVWSLLLFFLRNFGPLIAFQTVNFFAGTVAALWMSMAVVIGEGLWLAWRREKPSTLFLLSASVCLIFGAADLAMGGTAFQTYEAPLMNLFLAAAFGISLRDKKSLVQKVAEGKHDVSGLDEEDRRFFFRGFTVVWAFYYLVRAAVFLSLNLSHGALDGFWLRLVIGKISFVLLIAASTMAGRPLWILCLRWRLLPSTRRPVSSIS